MPAVTPHHITIMIPLVLCLLTALLCGVTPAFGAEYRVAVRANNGIEAARAQWQPTLDYLNEVIPQHHFKLDPILDINELNIAARSQAYDFVLTNPSSYVVIEHFAHATALATLNNKRGDTAQNHFGSVIFTRADHDSIQSLDDLRGKTIIGVAPNAFAGWQLAWYEFIRQGINPERDFKRIDFADDLQQRVVERVLSGDDDVGVVRTDQLERMAEAGELDLRYIRVINQQQTANFPYFHSTPLYPEWPFAVLPHVPASDALIVKASLLAITAKNPAAMAGQYMGWVQPLDYQPVRSLLASLNQLPGQGSFQPLKDIPSWVWLIIVLTLMAWLANHIVRRYTASKAATIVLK